MYSLSTSFCTVPPSFRRATPCSSPTTTYIASRMAAVALIVIEVVTWSSGMPRKRSARSSTVSIATPTRPTSPSAIGWSESYPIWVGRSNAVDNPLCPASSSRWNRRLVSSAVPNPAYCRMVQSRPVYIDGWMPRVKGNSPGGPRSLAGSPVQSPGP